MLQLSFNLCLQPSLHNPMLLVLLAHRPPLSSALSGTPAHAAAAPAASCGASPLLPSSCSPTILNHRNHNNTLNDKVMTMLGSVAGKQVLELGAGIGRFTCELAPLAASCTAVDFMQNLIDQNKAKNGHLSNCTFMASDVMDLAPGPGSYDVVFSNWLLMYLGDKEVQMLAQRMLEWVRAGLVLCATSAVPACASLSLRARGRCWVFTSARAAHGGRDTRIYVQTITTTTITTTATKTNKTKRPIAAARSRTTASCSSASRASSRAATRRAPVTPPTTATRASTFECLMPSPLSCPTAAPRTLSWSTASAWTRTCA